MVKSDSGKLMLLQAITDLAKVKRNLITIKGIWILNYNKTPSQQTIFKPTDKVISS